MKKKIDFDSLWQRYGKNPYLSKFNKTKKIPKQGGYKYEYNDKDPFVKIYFGADGSSVLELFFNRTQELKVFCYVLRKLEINTGLVEIDYEDCAKFMGLNQKQVSKGVNFLLQQNIMSKSLKYKCFYVNPEFSFNGDKFGLSMYRAEHEENKKEEKLEVRRKQLEEMSSFSDVRKAYKEDGHVPIELLKPKSK
jgi:hypothetical protein